MDIGSAVGRKAGISEEKILAINDYAISPLFSELERLVLMYADLMTQAPVEISDELFRRLGQNFSEAQLVELTSAIAWENYRARFDHALGMESEGFSEGSVCALPERAMSSIASQGRK